MRKAVFSTAIVLGISLALTGTPVNAAETETSKNFKEIVAHIDSDGVPKDEQRALANKVLSGKLLESDKQEATPIATETWSDDSFEYKKETFEDNSYRLMGLEKGIDVTSMPGALARGAGITGCTSTTGTGYVSRKNCKVFATGASYDASFRANYTHNGGTLGTISSATLGNVKGIGGVATGISTKVNRPRSDGRIAAQAYVKWTYTAAGGIAGGSSYVFLNVNGVSATVEVQ